MIALFSPVTSGIAAVIAILAWMTGTADRAARWVKRKRRAIPPLDPSGDDADWGV